MCLWLSFNLCGSASAIRNPYIHFYRPIYHLFLPGCSIQPEPFSMDHCLLRRRHLTKSLSPADIDSGRFTIVIIVFLLALLRGFCQTSCHGHVIRSSLQLLGQLPVMITLGLVLYKLSLRGQSIKHYWPTYNSARI